MQKGSLYAHIDSKQDLLYEAMSEGSRAFHDALDAVDNLPASERIRLALRAHLRVVSEQLDVATVFVREWRYWKATGPRSSWPSADATRSASARSSARAAKAGALRTDLDDQAAWCATRPLGGELGVHLAAAARGRHGRAGGPVLRDPPGRHPGVLNAGLNERGAGFPAPRFARSVVLVNGRERVDDAVAVESR